MDVCTFEIANTLWTFYMKQKLALQKIFGNWVCTCHCIGEHTTSHGKPLMFWFPCKEQYINVRTCNLLTFLQLSTRSVHITQ